jgi:hypothetical protein
VPRSVIALEELAVLTMKALLLAPSSVVLEEPTTWPEALMPLARLKFPPSFRVPKSVADPWLNTAAWLKSFPKAESPTTKPELLIPNPRLMTLAECMATSSIGILLVLV